MADDYNIGNFGEFDTFTQEARDLGNEYPDIFPPETFIRPQSTIGGYDERGYTLPASEPDSWFWGYSRPGDVVEQERGIYPFMQRHAPEWFKDAYRGARGAWGGITDDTIQEPGLIENMFEWTSDYLSPDQQQAGLWQDIKRILKRTKNPGPLIDQWTDHWNKYAANDKGIGSLDEYQTASNLHPDEHIYPVYIDYMSTMNPGTKPLMGFEQWKQEVYPYLDVGIDSTLSRT